MPTVSKQTAPRMAIIIKALISGATIKAACAKANIAVSTLAHWRQNDETFDITIREALTARERIHADLANENMLQLLIDGDWDATKLALQNLDPRYARNNELAAATEPERYRAAADRIQLPEGE